MLRGSFLVMCMALIQPSHVFAEGQELDHLALATVMLKDGHIKRAAAALKSVDLKDESVDQVRYFTISGVIAMRLKDFTAALKAFDKVIALGQGTPAIHITRARCAFALKACDTVEEALSAAGDDAWKDRELLVMRSECAWTEKNYEVAIDVLARGKTLFPEERQFVRKHIERLMELGLYQTASEVGEELLSGENTSPDDILFLAEALLRAGAAKTAVLTLEGAQLAHPDDNRIKAQAAHAWLAYGRPLTAARQFMKASMVEEKYARDAAEIYREGGFLQRALRSNGQILKQRLKLRQRLSLLLDMERFEAVVALEPRLSRLDLLRDDEEIRYALAYALFRTRQFKRAEIHLKKLTDAKLFTRAAELRKAMADCRRDASLCD